MSDRGKVDPAFFEETIAPRLGADRGDVALGPRHGVDFGVLDIGNEALVVAADPLSVPPALGFERAGALAVDIVLADVAVSGIAPTHLTVSLTLPPDMSDADLAAAWRGVDAHASSLGVSIVTGHTARYEGVSLPWVGGATAMGVGDHDHVVRPDGARPGDAIMIATGPGAEAAGLLATLYPDAIDLPAERLTTARERTEDILAVGDANAIHDAARRASGDGCEPNDTEPSRVTAMHDATEGGIAAALHEMADGAGVRFDIDRDAVPVAGGVEAVCGAVGVDPWRVSSAGTLLVTLAPAAVDGVLAALDARDTPAAVVGEVRAGTGVHADGDPIERPASDPLWDAFANLTDLEDGG